MFQKVKKLDGLVWSLPDNAMLHTG